MIQIILIIQIILKIQIISFYPSFRMYFNLLTLVVSMPLSTCRAPVFSYRNFGIRCFQLKQNGVTTWKVQMKNLSNFQEVGYNMEIILKMEVQQFMSKLKYRIAQLKVGYNSEGYLFTQFPVASLQGSPPRQCYQMIRNTISCEFCNLIQNNNNTIVFIDR